METVSASARFPPGWRATQVSRSVSGHSCSPSAAEQHLGLGASQHPHTGRMAFRVIGAEQVRGGRAAHGHQETIIN
ncbi:hypothetical protein [Microbispora sp. H10885]|uniref:hypothetical protein n=1 Tax=Microbispora sp. H10885 TaxID=2729110 RepID=UPI001601D0BA|nr:hypothetical protein [Microbispora sp. H10885]